MTPEGNDHTQDLLCIFPSPWLQIGVSTPNLHPAGPAPSAELAQSCPFLVSRVPSPGLSLASCSASGS